VYELAEAAAQVAVMSANEVLVELTKIARANMADFIRAFFACGDPVAAVDQLRPEQTAALIEVTVEDFMDGRTRTLARFAGLGSSWRARSMRSSCSASITSSTSSGTNTGGAPASPIA
jgi:hypothetical protein